MFPHGMGMMQPPFAGAAGAAMHPGLGANPIPTPTTSSSALDPQSYTAIPTANTVTGGSSASGVATTGRSFMSGAKPQSAISCVYWCYGYCVRGELCHYKHAPEEFECYKGMPPGLPPPSGGGRGPVAKQNAYGVVAPPPGLTVNGNAVPGPGAPAPAGGAAMLLGGAAGAPSASAPPMSASGGGTNYSVGLAPPPGAPPAIVPGTMGVPGIGSNGTGIVSKAVDPTSAPPGAGGGGGAAGAAAAGSGPASFLSHTLLVNNGPQNAQLTGGTLGLATMTLKLTESGHISCGPQRYAARVKSYDALRQIGYLDAHLISERFQSGADVALSSADVQRLQLTPGSVVSFVLVVNNGPEKKPQAEQVEKLDPFQFVPGLPKVFPEDESAPAEEDTNLSSLLAGAAGDLAEDVDVVEDDTPADEEQDPADRSASAGEDEDLAPMPLPKLPKRKKKPEQNELDKQITRDLENLEELVENDMFVATPLIPIERLEDLKRQERRSASRERRAKNNHKRKKADAGSDDDDGKHMKGRDASKAASRSRDRGRGDRDRDRRSRSRDRGAGRSSRDRGRGGRERGKRTSRDRGGGRGRRR